MYPLVSVVMNCFNGEKYLRFSLKSVLNQTYQNIEIIFWDNLSSDDSAKIVKNLKDKRIKYYRGDKFVNLYEARNLAIKKAKGDFITFLDTDDWWKKNKIEKQLQLYKRKEEKIDVIYSNCYLYNNKNKTKKLFVKNNLPEGNITKELIHNYRVALPTLFVNKRVFLKEKFNKKYNIIGDFDFVVRISQKNFFACIQEPLAFYRMHENNYSIKNLETYTLELKEWIKDNKENLKKKNISTKSLLVLIYKLKIKKILNFFKIKTQFFLGV